MGGQPATGEGRRRAYAALSAAPLATTQGRVCALLLEASPIVGEEDEKRVIPPASRIGRRVLVWTWGGEGTGYIWPAARMASVRVRVKVGERVGVVSVRVKGSEGGKGAEGGRVLKDEGEGEGREAKGEG